MATRHIKSQMQPEIVSGASATIVNIKVWEPPKEAIVVQSLNCDTVPPESVRHLLSDRPLRRHG